MVRFFDSLSCAEIIFLNYYTAVILLDELEKAHKVCSFKLLYLIMFSIFFNAKRTLQDVALILLQILDEGTITDSQGRKVDFKVSKRPSCPFSSSYDNINRTQSFV